MAKTTKGCGTKTVQFKTRRGRTVRFTGRPGGQEKCGRRRRKVSAWAHKVGKIGKACARVGRPGTARNASCLKTKIRELKARA